MKLPDLFTIVALIFLGVALPVCFIQAMDAQAKLDNREAHRALVARLGR